MGDCDGITCTSEAQIAIDVSQGNQIDTKRFCYPCALADGLIEAIPSEEEPTQ